MGIKIGERMDKVRSFSPKDRRKGNKRAGAGVTNGQQAGFLEVRHDKLQNGTDTIHMDGDGSMDHAGQQALREPSEQVTNGKYAPDATDETSTAHLVEGVTTNTFDQQ